MSEPSQGLGLAIWSVETHLILNPAGGDIFCGTFFRVNPLKVKRSTVVACTVSRLGHSLGCPFILINFLDSISDINM